MNCRSSSLAFAFATLCFAGCAVEGGATDDTGANPASNGAAAPAALHCVQSVSSNQSSCFDSFTAAIAAATGQRITDAPADAQAALSDPGFRARINALAAPSPRAGVLVTPLTTVVVGIEYRDINFQGPTLTYTAGAGCDGDLSTIDYQVAGVQDPWNDQISSFIAFSNCSEQLYEDANFLGSQTPIAQSMVGLGAAMNDRASSIRWF